LALVNDLQAAGAITVGRLDANGVARGRDLDRRKLDVFAPYGMKFDRGAALTVAGVAALVLAAEPALDPAALEQRLLDSADAMYQASDPRTGEWRPAAVQVDPRTGDYSPGESAFRFRRVNAARAVGVSLDVPWPVEALNAPAAWKTATGRGVTVAVLDQGFHVDNPAFQGHLVDKAAFYPGQDFGGTQNFHGTSMAKIVLAVAPDVSLVFLHHSENYGDMDGVIQAYIKAIDYAIAHKVDVITDSAGPWPNTPEVHAAIDRAIAAGIVFVWFHYDGANEAVIRPGHFYYPIWEVGAFDRFFDDDKPSDLEGGLSDTAPQIAAIAALILQNEPNLSPWEVKQRILTTAAVLPNGNSLADAAAAVQNRPSGRELPQVDHSAIGHCEAVYQVGTQMTTSLTIDERGEHWTLPLWPHQDILLLRYAWAPDSAAGSKLRLEAHGEGGTVLIAQWAGPLASGRYAGQVALRPDQGSAIYYVLKAGEGGVPPIEVEVDGDRVRITWESAVGARMEATGQTGGNQLSEYRLYRFQAEAQLLSDVIATDY
jgi:hypothetical protein